MTFSATNILKQDPDTIVDDNYLITFLKFTKSFINQHARAMGSFGKPRRFFLKNVINHLDDLADKSISKHANKGKQETQKIREINKLVDLSVSKRMTKQSSASTAI